MDKKAMSTLVRNFGAIVTLFSLPPGPSGRPDSAHGLLHFLLFDITSVDPPVLGLFDQITGDKPHPGVNCREHADHCQRACNNNPLWATKNNPPCFF